MNFVNLIITRGISTSCVRNGKRNFRKFQLPNKRGSRQFKEARRLDPNPDIPIDSMYFDYLIFMILEVLPTGALKNIFLGALTSLRIYGSSINFRTYRCLK